MYVRCGKQLERSRAGGRSSIDTEVTRLLLAADYPFLDVFWTICIFFAWVIWIYLLVMVLGDNFRRHDHNGWAKAAWTVFVIFLPLLGALVYMIARPSEDKALYA